MRCRGCLSQDPVAVGMIDIDCFTFLSIATKTNAIVPFCPKL